MIGRKRIEAARERLIAPVVRWLRAEVRPLGPPRHDFERLQAHLREGDVLLVEGRSRVSGVIQSVTLSSWTHAALYVGTLDSVRARGVDTRSLRAAGIAPGTPMLLEAEIGRGVHLSPISRYRHEHLRLCRARELADGDGEHVIAYVLARLGTPYNLRQIGDLLRFFFPYGLLPRRWRSTLFETASGPMTRTICSTLIAQAFASVRYPILPTLHRSGDGRIVFYRRNTRLVTPRDFDHSPYFDIVKYPLFGDDVARYRELDWADDVEPQASAPSE